MPYPEPPKQKPLVRKPVPGQKERGSLALRIERAAGDLNPFLVVVAIGLLVLNLTLYLGMAAARQPMAWAPPQTTHQASAAAASSGGAAGRSAPPAAATAFGR